MSSLSARPQRRYGRQALWVCGVAFLIHLVPIALLKMGEAPDSRLDRARQRTDIIERAEILRPLEEDERATPSQLREGASLLLELGASGDARFLAEEAVRRQPDAYANQLLLSRIFALERMPRALERAVARAREMKPAEVEPWLVLARYQKSEGEAERAVATLRSALKANPGAPELTLTLANWLTEAGTFAEAEALIVRAGSGSAEHLLALGVLRHRQGRIDDAVAALKEALTANPKLGEAHYLLGSILYEKGMLPSAEDALRRAERLSPEDPRPLAAICTLQAATGRKDAARATGMDFRRRFPARFSQLNLTCRGG